MRKTYLLVAITLVALTFALTMPKIAYASPIAIEYLSPSEGPVGTLVQLVGNIDTLGGDYEIWWDDWLLLAEGQTLLNETEVEEIFTVPMDYVGDHEVRLYDLTADTSGYAIFQITTAYTARSDPDYIQEGSSVDIWLSMTGMPTNLQWEFETIVTDSSGIEQTATIQFILLEPTPTWQGVIATYPDDFNPPVSNTTFLGIYSVVVDQILPQEMEAIATTEFFVGILNATSYDRFETVGIHAEGYPEPEPWTAIVDITFEGESVEGYPKEVDVIGGNVDDEWDIPFDAPLGTYTVSITAFLGEETFIKDIPDVQDFEVVGVGVLSVQIVTFPEESYDRTETVLMEFQVTYPDNTYFTPENLGTLPVYLYYEDENVLVETFYLSQDNFNPETDIWNVTWNIPRSIAIGTYNLTFLSNTIIDTRENQGPEETLGEDFGVEPAPLTVNIIEVYPQEGYLYNRTTYAYMDFNITYPDGSLYTVEDWGTITVTIYTWQIVEEFNLTATDYNPLTGVWTASWKIPWNASIAMHYFVFFESNIIDQYENSLQEDIWSPFEVVPCIVTIPALHMDKPYYTPEEFPTVWFKAYYPDGTEVTTGEADLYLYWGLYPQVEIAYGVALYDEADQRFEVGIWWYFGEIPLKPEINPYGTWTVVLEAGNFLDEAENWGPYEDMNVTYEVYNIKKIQVDAEVGTIHFAGELAEFYIVTALDGVLTDVDSFDVLQLYKPDGTTETLLYTHVGTGVYKVTYSIPAEPVEGTYALVVQVSKDIDPHVYAYGDSMATFLVSPTLTGWNAKLIEINEDIATIKTDVNIIKMNITDLKVQLEAKIDTFKEETFLILETNLGKIMTRFDNIDANLTVIKDGIALLDTKLGTIEVKISDLKIQLEAKIDTSKEEVLLAIDTALGVIETRFETVDAKLVDIQDDMAIIDTKLGQVKVKLDDIKAQIVGVIQDAEGNILAAIDTALGQITVRFDQIDAKLVSIQGDLATISTTLGDIEVKLDDIKAQIVGVIEDAEGNILVAIDTALGQITVRFDQIDAKLVSIQGDLATISTTLGDIETKIDNIGAVSLEEIKGDIATIKSDIGTIQEDVSDINGEIVAINGEIVTISTDIGDAEARLSDINAKIKVTNDNVATIETDIGTIKGRLTSIEGDVATIETDIGTIKTTTDAIQTTGESIKTDTSLQPATVALSLIAAISAIAAAVMVLRKVYVK